MSNRQVCPIEVVKVGGSLFDLPDLKERLRRFLASLDKSKVLVVTGGGEIVEALRCYDAIHHLNPETSHWLSVELMHSTAQLLKEIAEIPVLIKSTIQLSDWVSTNVPSTGNLAVVSPGAFYSKTLASSELPISWDTTSDTISLLLAKLVNADRLTLLKSTSSGEHVVDANFECYLKSIGSQLQPEFRIQVVNLRTN
jgi:5-(aminomethyl)-3-furanmethanol phosphate kinase